MKQRLFDLFIFFAVAVLIASAMLAAFFIAAWIGVSNEPL